MSGFDRRPPFSGAPSVGKARRDVDRRLPLAVRRDRDRERETLLVVLRGLARGDRGVTLGRCPGCTRAPAVNASTRVDDLPFFLQCVLHLEQVGEIAARVDADDELDRLVVVIEDGELLVESGADRAAPDHRQLRVDVDGAGPGHEEESALEVLHVVDRQRVETIPVDREHPLRQEARVEREQPGRVGERGFDVAAAVTHDEGVAVEDLHEVIGHCDAPFPPVVPTRTGLRLAVAAGSGGSVGTRGAGRCRLRRSPRRASTAAIAFSRPDASLSNSGFGARNTQSAAPALCDTATSPLRTSTRQRSTVLPSVSSNRNEPDGLFEQRLVTDLPRDRRRTSPSCQPCGSFLEWGAGPRRGRATGPGSSA